MKNLLISAFSGYDEVSKVSDLVNSWNAVKKEGDEFIVATSGEPTVCHEFLDDNGITLRWMDKTGLPFYELGSPIHPYHDRFWWYQHIIQNEGTLAEQVMCVDIRDVVFQYNPFDWLKHHRNKRIVACDEGIFHDEEWNGFMLATAFKKQARRAAKIPVLNCGVIAGSMIDVAEICGQIAVKSNDAPQSAMHEGKEVMVIADQTAYSLLLEKENIQKEPNSSNWCLTMGTAASTLKEMRVTNGQFVNEAGEAYAVIHQYDRHEILRYDGAHNTFYAKPKNQAPVESFIFQSPSP